jgi:hypothetical protein
MLCVQVGMAKRYTVGSKLKRSTCRDDAEAQIRAELVSLLPDSLSSASSNHNPSATRLTFLSQHTPE